MHVGLARAHMPAGNACWSGSFGERRDEHWRETYGKDDSSPRPIVCAGRSQDEPWLLVGRLLPTSSSRSVYTAPTECFLHHASRNKIKIAHACDLLPIRV